MRSGKFRNNPVLLLFVAGGVVFAGSARGQDANPMNPGGMDSALGGQSGTSTDSSSGADLSGQMQGGRGMQQSSTPRGVNLPNGQDINASGGNNGIIGNNQRGLNQTPPPPPSEFQRMVATSTGKLLPIYGAN